MMTYRHEIFPTMLIKYESSSVKCYYNRSLHSGSRQSPHILYKKRICAVFEYSHIRFFYVLVLYTIKKVTHHLSL